MYLIKYHLTDQIKGIILDQGNHSLYLKDLLSKYYDAIHEKLDNKKIENLLHLIKNENITLDSMKYPEELRDIFDYLMNLPTVQDIQREKNLFLQYLSLDHDGMKLANDIEFMVDDIRLYRERTTDNFFLKLESNFNITKAILKFDKKEFADMPFHFVSDILEKILLLKNPTFQNTEHEFFKRISAPSYMANIDKNITKVYFLENASIDNDPEFYVFTQTEEDILEMIKTFIRLNKNFINYDDLVINYAKSFIEKDNEAYDSIKDDYLYFKDYFIRESCREKAENSKAFKKALEATNFYSYNEEYPQYKEMNLQSKEIFRSLSEFKKQLEDNANDTATMDNFLTRVHVLPAIKYHFKNNRYPLTIIEKS